MLTFDSYFRMQNMFGLACFENMPVESRVERGARMKSVGILATSYTLLYRHMQFLETQVRYRLDCQKLRTQKMMTASLHAALIFLANSRIQIGASSAFWKSISPKFRRGKGLLLAHRLLHKYPPHKVFVILRNCSWDHTVWASIINTSIHRTSQIYIVGYFASDPVHICFTVASQC